MHKSHGIIKFTELRRKPGEKLVDACQVMPFLLIFGFQVQELCAKNEFSD